MNDQIIELANDAITHMEMFKHWVRHNAAKADEHLFVARRKLDQLQREVVLATRNSGEVK